MNQGWFLKLIKINKKSNFSTNPFAFMSIYEKITTTQMIIFVENNEKIKKKIITYLFFSEKKKKEKVWSLRRKEQESIRKWIVLCEGTTERERGSKKVLLFCFSGFGVVCVFLHCVCLLQNPRERERVEFLDYLFVYLFLYDFD